MCRSYGARSIITRRFYQHYAPTELKLCARYGLRFWDYRLNQRSSSYCTENFSGATTAWASGL